MRTVQTGPVIGLIGQLAVLGALAGSVGLGVAGWSAGLACGAVTYAALVHGMSLPVQGRSATGAPALGPADRVTLTRATLVGGVAALIADSFVRVTPVPTLVGLTVVALVLDAVDGWVARRTGTSSPLGARFDMEVDAFLIFVLSVYAARTFGTWVLAIGAARYAYVAAGWLLGWLRGSVPPRYWRKVVAAVAGIVLACAASALLPHALTAAALVAALALLAESFGRDVWWLWHRRRHAVIHPDRRGCGRESRVGGTRIVALHAFSPETASRDGR